MERASGTSSSSEDLFLIGAMGRLELVEGSSSPYSSLESVSSSSSVPREGIGGCDGRLPFPSRPPPDPEAPPRDPRIPEDRPPRLP